MKFSSVVFDFDSTLVDVETIELVSEKALLGRSDKETTLKEIHHITELGMEGKIRFDESLSRRMKLIAPRREDVREIARGMIARITPSVSDRMDFFAENRSRVYIVSGGFEEIIFPVSDLLGIDRTHVFANAFVYDDKDIATGVDLSRPLSQHLGKVHALQAAELRRPLAMVGDGFTDYEVKAHGEADVFIAYVEHTHRESVIAHADHVAKSFDEVLAYLEGSRSTA